MRYALGSLFFAGLLFIGAAVGAVGSWALPVSAVALLVGAVIGAIAMEENDLGSDERPLSSSGSLSDAHDSVLGSEALPLEVA